MSCPARPQHPTVFEPIPEPGPSAVGQERIRVVVRARPLDRRSRAKEAWTCSNASEDRVCSRCGMRLDTLLFHHPPHPPGNPPAPFPANHSVSHVTSPLPTPPARTVELRQDVALKHDAAFYGAQPKSRTVTFEFDEVFTAEHNSHHVYRRSLRPIVEAALDGINGTVFAYG